MALKMRKTVEKYIITITLFKKKTALYVSFLKPQNENLRSIKCSEEIGVRTGED